MRAVGRPVGWAALVLAHGCSSLPLPPVDARMQELVRSCGLSLELVVQGRALMVSACASCHHPVHPAWGTLRDWDGVLPRMLEKSQLTSDDGAAVRAYVVAVLAAEAK
jgi:hypothetical protein